MSDKPKRNKWASRRWIVCLWAMLMASLIGSVSLFRGDSPAWVGIVLPTLIAIPAAYIAAESYTKTRIHPGGGTVE